MNRGFRIGIVGLGNMGRNHVRVLSMLKSVELSFIYDVDTTRAAELAHHYGTTVSADPEKDMDEIDGLVVVTPTTSHLEWMERSAGRVPHIFLEKPLAGRLEDAERIHKVITDTNTHLQVGFIERYNPAVVSLRGVLKEAGAVPVNVSFTRTNKVSSRITDVDVVADLMIHDIDLATYLNGSIDNVTAYGRARDGMVEFAAAVLTHSSGSFSHLTASRITERRIRNIEVTCEDMHVACDLLRKEIEISRQSVTQAYQGVFVSSTIENVQVTNQEPLLSEHIDFVGSSTADSEFHGVGLNVVRPDVDSALEASRIAHSITEQIVGKNPK